MSSSRAVMESQFTEQFKERLERSDSDGLRALREQAFEFFEENGYPTVKNEDWKYTNVAPIGKEVWHVASVRPNRSSTDERFGELFGKFRFARNGFAALNQAFAHIVTVTIPKDTKI